MAKCELTRVQLGWIVLALEHELVRVKDEMSEAGDGSPIYSIGEIVLETRQSLINKLQDVINGTAKTVTIK